MQQRIILFVLVFHGTGGTSVELCDGSRATRFHTGIVCPNGRYKPSHVFFAPSNESLNVGQRFLVSNHDAVWEVQSVSNRVAHVTKQHLGCELTSDVKGVDCTGGTPQSLVETGPAELLLPGTPLTKGAIITSPTRKFFGRVQAVNGTSLLLVSREAQPRSQLADVPWLEVSKETLCISSSGVAVVLPEHHAFNVGTVIGISVVDTPVSYKVLSVDGSTGYVKAMEVHCSQPEKDIKFRAAAVSVVKPTVELNCGLGLDDLGVQVTATLDKQTEWKVRGNFGEHTEVGEAFVMIEAALEVPYEFRLSVEEINLECEMEISATIALDTALDLPFAPRITGSVTPNFKVGLQAKLEAAAPLLVMAVSGNPRFSIQMQAYGATGIGHTPLRIDVLYVDLVGVRQAMGGDSVELWFGCEGCEGDDDDDRTFEDNDDLENKEPHELPIFVFDVHQPRDDAKFKIVWKERSCFSCGRVAPAEWDLKSLVDGQELSTEYVNFRVSFPTTDITSSPAADFDSTPKLTPSSDLCISSAHINVTFTPRITFAASLELSIFKLKPTLVFEFGSVSVGGDWNRFSPQCHNTALFVPFAAINTKLFVEAAFTFTIGKFSKNTSVRALLIDPEDIHADWDSQCTAVSACDDTKSKYLGNLLDTLDDVVWDVDDSSDFSKALRFGEFGFQEEVVATSVPEHVDFAVEFVMQSDAKGLNGFIASVFPVADDSSVLPGLLVGGNEECERLKGDWLTNQIQLPVSSDCPETSEERQYHYIGRSELNETWKDYVIIYEHQDNATLDITIQVRQHSGSEGDGEWTTVRKFSGIVQQSKAISAVKLQKYSETTPTQEVAFVYLAVKPRIRAVCGDGVKHSSEACDGGQLGCDTNCIGSNDCECLDGLPSVDWFKNYNSRTHYDPSNIKSIANVEQQVFSVEITVPIILGTLVLICNQPIDDSLPFPQGVPKNCLRHPAAAISPFVEAAEGGLCHLSSELWAAPVLWHQKASECALVFTFTSPIDDWPQNSFFQLTRPAEDDNYLVQGTVHINVITTKSPQYSLPVPVGEFFRDSHAISVKQTVVLSTWNSDVTSTKGLVLNTVYLSGKIDASGFWSGSATLDHVASVRSCSLAPDALPVGLQGTYSDGKMELAYNSLANLYEIDIQLDCTTATDSSINLAASKKYINQNLESERYVRIAGEQSTTEEDIQLGSEDPLEIIIDAQTGAQLSRVDIYVTVNRNTVLTLVSNSKLTAVAEGLECFFSFNPTASSHLTCPSFGSTDRLQAGEQYQLICKLKYTGIKEKTDSKLVLQESSTALAALLKAENVIITTNISVRAYTDAKATHYDIPYAKHEGDRKILAIAVAVSAIAVLVAVLAVSALVAVWRRYTTAKVERFTDISSLPTGHPTSPDEEQQSVTPNNV